VLDIQQRGGVVGGAIECDHLPQQDSLGGVELHRRPEFQRAFAGNANLPSGNQLYLRLKHRPGRPEDLQAHAGMVKPRTPVRLHKNLRISEYSKIMPRRRASAGFSPANSQALA